MTQAFTLVSLVLLCLTSLASGYYLPGTASKNFKVGEDVQIAVNNLVSPYTAIPYEYYHPKFNFCGTRESVETSSLGSIVFGDRVFASPIKLKMKEDQGCTHICTRDMEVDNVKFIIQRIQEEYFHNWMIDGLPAANKVLDGKEEVYFVGFNLGIKDQNKVEYKALKPKLFNHYSIAIEVHPVKVDEETQYNVVGVVITPSSKSYHLNSKKEPNCQASSIPALELVHDQKVSVAFTYDVKWIESEKEWNHRWENYLHVFEPKIHWFSLINSFVIVFFLSFMVGMVLLRALHLDITRYNSPNQEESQEEYGWKLVHGDVFRTPNSPIFLSSFAGSGIQFLSMLAVVLALSLIGFLSPAIRGSMVTVAIVFYMLFGFVAGFCSARLYKMMGGEAWKRLVLLTAVFVPGTISLVMLIMNFILAGLGSSAAIPFGTLAGLLSMWILISCPLCFFGAFLGFRRAKVEFPVRINQIPRQIPPQSFHMQRVPSILLGGILPFGAIFIELFFILNSIWFNRLYYMFGFLALVFVILCITCSEMTILVCYFHLCSEDYRWWWRSFLTSGSTALYVFVFSVIYYFLYVQMSNVASILLYFGWSLIMSLVFFLMTGSIGFLSCLWFCLKIYSAIKID